MPAHAPLQPLKDQPLAGVATSCTIDPDVKLAAQVQLEHVSPAGALVTVPLPTTVADRACT